MAELVANCPRCGAKKITFDVTQVHYLRTEHGWQEWHEAFSICRECKRGTIFILSDSVDADYQKLHKTGILSLPVSINNYCRIERYVNIRDLAAMAPPEHVDDPVDAIFREGSTALAVECFNAAGTMYRLCLDLITEPLLPGDDEKVEGLNYKVRRDLGHRLPWLFANDLLPPDLEDLSSCVREDGNDGAHRGTLKKADALDLQEFTYALLHRICTEPKRIEAAQKRRDDRRKGA